MERVKSCLILIPETQMNKMGVDGDVQKSMFNLIYNVYGSTASDLWSWQYSSEVDCVNFKYPSMLHLVLKQSPETTVVRPVLDSPVSSDLLKHKWIKLLLM